MKKFHKTLMIGALVVGAATIFGTSQADALGERRGDMEGKHESMLEVFENGDYQGWLELVGDRPMAQEITENEFARFTEMHNFRIAGDHESAEAIAEELGLPEMRGNHEGMGGGEGMGKEGAGKDGASQRQGTRDGSGGKGMNR